jgi:ribosomal protein S12 methylthiotransferase accessory factor
MDPMPDRPRLRAGLYPERIGRDHFLLIETAARHELHGRLFADLLPLLDGHRTISEIAELLDARLSPLDVQHGVGLLAADGLLAGEDETGRDALPVAWLDAPGQDTERVTRNSAVHIAVSGSNRSRPLVEALSAAGVPARGNDQAGLVVILADDPLDPGVRSMLEAAWARGAASLLLRLDGPRPWIGPLTRPPLPPCSACAAARIAANRDPRAIGPLASGPAGPHRISQAAAAFVHERVVEIVREWREGRSIPALAGHVVTFDTATRRAERHVIVPRSNCPACGVRSAAAPAPGALAPDERTSILLVGGAYRAVSVARTWEAIRHHVSPLTGIVGHLAPIGAAAGEGIHVYVAGQNVARPDSGSIRALCAGKGVTEAEARVGAVCEALERHCGMYRGDEARVTSSHADLGDRAIDPREWLLFSDAQYASRETWNREHGAINWVPPRFDVRRAMDWTPVQSLRDGSVRYAPSQLCWYGHPEAGPSGCGRADSSGNAAGNDVAEAIVQGFMELVERDAVALWWYTRSHRPGISIESFESRAFDALARRYGELDRPLWMLDLTSDLGIPVVAALSLPRGGPSRDAIMGFGAHFDPSIAATRALTEMNQFLPRALRPGPRPRSAWLFDEERLGGNFLFPDKTTGVRKKADFTLRPHASLREAMLDCDRIAADAGLDVFLLDQSRPEIELSTVKVIVPGLRPMWARFAPGRLYEAPVRIGWRDAPCAERDLNPSHLLL